MEIGTSVWVLESPIHRNSSGVKLTKKRSRERRGLDSSQDAAHNIEAGKYLFVRGSIAYFYLTHMLIIGNFDGTIESLGLWRRGHILAKKIVKIFGIT